MNINKTKKQTYAFFNYISGFKGEITQKELPEMIKAWKENGVPLIKKEGDEFHIVIINRDFVSKWKKLGWKKLK